MIKMHELVIIDIDMTLANNLKRLMSCYDINHKKIDYDTFFSDHAIMNDTAIHGSRRALSIIRKKYKILFMSARPRKCLKSTYKWLRKNKMIKDRKELILVKRPEDKIKILKKTKKRLFLYIDDLAYDYQSGKPKSMKDLVKNIRSANIPLTIFKNNWTNIIEKYFIKI